MSTNDSSYQQIYSDPQLQLQIPNEDILYQNELMLDENDEIQLYQSQSNYHQFHQDDDDNDDYPDIRQRSIIDDLNQLDKQYSLDLHHQDHLKCQIIQTQCGEKDVIDYLSTNYSHLNQQILIKMLYEQFFPPKNNISINNLQSVQTLSNFTNIKTENVDLIANQQKDINSKLYQTAKVFVEHGYGINIARKYAFKGQNIEPNPYNNSIGKLIKNVWKDIETQIMKMKSIKHLRTEKYNQIKTPLIHCRNWMEKEYLDIFKQIILYVHGVSNQKPSQMSYQLLYNYVLQNAVRKNKSSERGFYKKKNNDIDESSSQQFKPSKSDKLTNERFEHLADIVKKSFNKSAK